MSILEEISTGHFGADPKIIARFGADLRKLYGPRLERAVLYGSRARGDAREDSDYDIAVFLTDYRSFGEESTRLAQVETESCLTPERLSPPCRFARAPTAAEPASRPSFAAMDVIFEKGHQPISE